jgi:hypothetical protein
MESLRFPWRPRADRLLRTLPDSCTELKPLGAVLAMVLFLRYLLFPIVGFFINATFPEQRPADFSVFEQPNPFWDIFARYDSGWFYNVARSGYHYVEGQPSNLAYFPLYPLMMAAGGWFLGGDQHHYYFAGMLISRAAFLAALVFLYLLARLDLDERGAQRAVLYTAVFPFAFFYSRVYSEALFLLLTVSSTYFFRTRRWELGGLAGGLASLTRVNGVLTVVALTRIAGDAVKGKHRMWMRPALALLAVVAGLGLFCWYSFSLTGSPVAWAAAISSWNYEPGGTPWTPLVALARQLIRRPFDFLTVEPNGPYDTLNGVTAAIFVGSVPFVWRRLGAAYGMHMLVNLWLPLSSGQFEGLGRYCAVLFPFFIWLASFDRQWLREIVLSSSIALYVLCVSYFIKLHPIF